MDTRKQQGPPDRLWCQEHVLSYEHDPCAPHQDVSEAPRPTKAFCSMGRISHPYLPIKPLYQGTPLIPSHRFMCNIYI